MPQKISADPSAPRNGLGSFALIMGVVAFVFAFVPVIGEFVAIPASVLAIVLGYVGFERAEKGLATNRGQALTGTALGLIAGLVVVLVFAAMQGPAS